MSVYVIGVLVSVITFTIGATLVVVSTVPTSNVVIVTLGIILVLLGGIGIGLGVDRQPRTANKQFKI